MANLFFSCLFLTRHANRTARCNENLNGIETETRRGKELVYYFTVFCSCPCERVCFTVFVYAMYLNIKRRDRASSSFRGFGPSSQDQVYLHCSFFILKHQITICGRCAMISALIGALLSLLNWHGHHGMPPVAHSCHKKHQATASYECDDSRSG